MSTELEKQYQIDILAEQASGYFSVPSEQDLAYSDLLFSICNQFGIHYYSVTSKERYSVEEDACALPWLISLSKLPALKIPSA